MKLEPVPELDEFEKTIIHDVQHCVDEVKNGVDDLYFFFFGYAKNKQAAIHIITVNDKRPTDHVFIGTPGGMQQLHIMEGRFYKDGGSMVFIGVTEVKEGYEVIEKRQAFYNISWMNRMYNLDAKPTLNGDHLKEIMKKFALHTKR